MISENIKTGLKLSEAIKLLEENDGALLKAENDLYRYDFLKSENWVCKIDRTYSVKLPPPKTVTVTRADIERVYYCKDYSLMDSNEAFEQFCKELGL